MIFLLSRIDNKSTVEIIEWLIYYKKPFIMINNIGEIIFKSNIDLTEERFKNGELLECIKNYSTL
jgi:hypothetical protein